jgi:hypothetical protein
MNSQELNKVYSAKTYSNKFLATEKQKDFIMDNISEQTYYNDKEQEEIMNNLDKLTKREATDIISNMMLGMTNDYDFMYDDWIYKD